MATPHSSWFSYNVTRPYDVRWFTPVTIVGGILVTALVSFISVGTSGYQLVTTSTTDPNGTEAAGTWYGHHGGAVIGSMQPHCDSANIPVYAALYTNNSAQPYNIQRVSRMNGNGSTTYQGSFAYHQNFLRNCNVNNIVLQFETHDGRSAAEIAISDVGMEAAANVTCDVEGPQGILSVVLQTMYSGPGTSFGPRKGGFNGFPGRNATTKSSLYYAESALLMTWIDLVRTFSAANRARDRPVSKGVMGLSRRNAPPISTNEITSLEMFEGACFFNTFANLNGSSPISTTIKCPKDLKIGSLANASNDVPFYSTWRSADAFAKAFYYTVLADLGQANDTHPNVFADADLLAYFTKDFASRNTTAHGLDSTTQVPVDLGLAVQPFDPTSISASNLHITPSVLSSAYSCQVPKLKPTGVLIVAVLTTNIVLLQTIWQTYKCCVDWSMRRKYPETA